MKTKLSILTLALFIALPSSAHIQVGTYLGKKADGSACTLISKGTTFQNNVRHPLNERVEVVVESETYSLYHPPVINAEKGLASFNHDAFHATRPTAYGADAVVVTMSHAEGKEGPTAYALIQHSWKTEQSTVMTCSNLVFQE